MNTREQIAYCLLDSKYRKIRRQVKLFNFENAKRVGVLWHLDDKEGFLYISDFLKKKQVISRYLCYTGTSSEVIANSFGKKETNFFGFPKKGVANSFMEVEYDLLVNISVNDCFPLKFVTALTNAHFKIGTDTGSDNYFDLSIKIEDNKNSLYLVKQQIHYIEQFNKKELE
ncbi:MAG: hypothetical protein HQ541_04655 [Mariniphaga sp.]|nr:hypothetical protein [Mariniphaga sp.]